MSNNANSSSSSSSSSHHRNRHRDKRGTRTRYRSLSPLPSSPSSSSSSSLDLGPELTEEQMRAKIAEMRANDPDVFTLIPAIAHEAMDSLWPDTPGSNDRHGNVPAVRLMVACEWWSVVGPYQIAAEVAEREAREVKEVKEAVRAKQEVEEGEEAGRVRGGECGRGGRVIRRGVEEIYGRDDFVGAS